MQIYKFLTNRRKETKQNGALIIIFSKKHLPITCFIHTFVIQTYQFLTMANKRDLKKMINYICSDLFAECIATSLYEGKDEENVKSILTSILITHNSFLKRISHVEPGIKPKLYFLDLKKNFNEEVSKIIDNIVALN